MIISSTPYRVSLFGGGSDYPEYLAHNHGKVLSFSLKSYSHLIIRPLSSVFDNKFRIRYFQRQEADTVEQIQHPIVRHCLMRYWRGSGLDITHTGDLPAMSGMGTSSAFTVGLVKALHALTMARISKKRLARESIYIEQTLNGENVGSQDQVAASFGGFNLIHFFAPLEFKVNPLQVDSRWLNTFISSLRLVFTGLTRQADEVAKQVRAEISISPSSVNALRCQVEDAFEIITKQRDPRLLGELLHEAWKTKRAVSTSISNLQIDAVYARIRSAGAVGGKLLGAGSGGFILAYVPTEKLATFEAELWDLKILKIDIDWYGSRVRRFG